MGHERDEHRVEDVVSVYDRDAGAFADAYESLAFDTVHAAVLDRLPDAPAAVLDVGAGSGRDAAWFAARGHDVVAVEPADGLREAGRKRHPSPAIRWMDDTLPGLERIVRSGHEFDLVWLRAVWMHVPPSHRARAFRKLAGMLRPGGAMMLSLRHGPPPADRTMHPVDRGEIERLARHHGLALEWSASPPNGQGRPDITWEVLWLRLPDDGTGALPLLRHIVFNEQKASTYKLALLRVLVRIANDAAGLARDGGDGERVELPFGLVALYWLRSFLPLIDADLPQHPTGNARMGFVKTGFRGIAARSRFDLRVGRRFTGGDAIHLVHALRDARNCIRAMPAHYTTYPGSAEPVFPTAPGKRFRATDDVVLDEPFLWQFGTLSVPRHLWRAMSRYGAWIEPSILGEWTEIMRQYGGPRAPGLDTHFEALRWLDPKHDTGLVRRIGEQLRARGATLHCVWSGRRLSRGFDVDHCFPFAAWPCNDLWNLVPASRDANARKGNRLPSANVLDTARSRIVEWWEMAYLGNEDLRAQFAREATSALPLVADTGDPLSGESLFEGVMMQRIALRRDQQLAEWQEG